MKIEFHGFEETQRELNDLSKKADSLNDTHSIPFDELFPATFMQKYSNYNDFDEFATESSFDFSDIEAIDEDELNLFIQKSTNLSSWDDMVGKASEAWAMRQLGL